MMKNKDFWPYLALLVTIFLTSLAALFLNLGTSASLVVVNLRLPRLLAALIGGAAVGVSGLLLQAALRNVVADPGIIGVSASANFFALAFGILFPSFYLGKIITAFVGDGLTIVLLFYFSQKISPDRLILAGLGLNAAFSALEEVTGQNGMSLATSNWTSSLTLVFLAVPLLAAATILAPSLTYLKFSDSKLQSWGLEAGKLRLGLLAIAAFLAAAATDSLGPVSFLGILAPQLARLLDSKGKNQLPLTLLAGSAILAAADTIGRLALGDLSATLLLAIVGGPVLIYLLIREGKA